MAGYGMVGSRRIAQDLEGGQVDVGTSEAAPNNPNGPDRRPGWCDAMRRKHQRGYPGRFTRLASRYRSLFTLVWTFLALLSVPGFNGFAHAQSATHRVTFEGKFTPSALAGGVSVPSGEHFTTLIGAVHNGGATFWSSGVMASTQPRNDAGNNEYIVTVRATGGTAERAMTSEQTITVTVTDVDEPPEAPEAPTVRAASLTSLAATWTAPANTGPAITGYDVRYKATGGAFTNWNHDSANTTTTITGLTPNRRYYVQVRARNHEGPSDWSESGALPNIIWIMADDLGYGDLGSYAQTQILTPNLDRIASEGMRFTDAYSGAPSCAPSRSVLMTGQHAGRTRVWWNYSLGLWDEDVTVAELLGASGYATALIGKWGLGEEDSPGAPWRQGFDYFFGYLNQGHAQNYYPEFLIRNPGTRVPLNNVVVPAPYNDRDLVGVATQREDYSHDLFISDALDWVESRENTPFFLYLALTIPHANTAARRWVIPEELAGHRERKGMEVPDAGAYQNEDWPGPQKGTAAMITRMDAGVGQIIDKLKELNIDEQTVVFFTSDNGPHSQGGNDSRFFNSNGPLQGEKGSLHDGGIRVPMIVRWPGRVPAGTVSNLVWYFADFLPTMAELVGFENPDGIDGASILPDLLGGSSRIGDRLIYWWNGRRVDGARWGSWKAVRESMDQPLELFDLHQDLGERNDVASTNQDVATTMLDYMASAVTNEIEKIRADEPEVSSVEFTSSPASGQNGAYKLGDVIEVTATFSDGVTVTTTDGAPQIDLTLGSTPRKADYVGGSTTQQLLFQYTVQATGQDTDGATIEANGLKRNGGRIRKNGTVLHTTLTHGTQTDQSGHRVDGVKPRLAASGGAVVNGTTLTLTWDEPINTSSTPEAGDFTVAGGDQERTVSRIVVRGTSVVLTLDSAAEHREAGIQMSYTPGANPIQDAVGNDARPLANRAVENNTRDTTAPVITTTSPILVPENETAVATLNATDDNTPIDQLTWTIPSGTNGGADADRFALSDAGALSFKAAKDYEIPDDADGDRTYEVTVQVSDGDNPVTADLLVTLENVLELTPLTGPPMVDYPENKALRVAAYIASSEEDREGLDWILSGADANRFSIGNPGGVLRFDIDPIAPDVSLQPPDFEDPADSNTDNVYSVTLAASDGTDTVTLDVSVTVGDENEAGTLSLDSPRPRFGEALTASVTDPDGDVSAITWKWERSAGRNAWVVIDGASAASYTPTAADTGAYLRVNVTYTDRHDVGQTAQRVAPNVVAARKLSRLEVTTSSSRSMYPAFDPEILHYAVGCQNTLTLTLSTDETDTRLAVNGIQRANRNVAVELTGLAGGSDIPITLTGSEGASTTYVLHCLADDFPAIVTEKKPGAWDGLITIGVPIASPASPASYLAMIDNNGVPRIHWRIFARVRIFRTHRDGRYPYSYGKQVLTRNVIVLDENLEPVDTVTTVPPLHHTDLHDFVIKSNGNYLLLAYEPARRDLSQFTNSDGNPYSTTEDTRDSVIQEVTPDKDEAFNWNSWDHMAVEDCTQHRFPDDYAHVNSVQAFDDDIVASFRGCSKVLRIDGDSGDVMWRLGKSNRSAADWAASGTQPPLRIVGDPYGEFCGQHSARMIDNGNLLLFDNGVACLVDPEGNRTRPGEDFSRVVEYAIDPDHGEAIFQRHYSYHGEFNELARTQGHIELLETGNWLISWGSMPVNEQVTEYSPLTGEEVLIVKIHVLGDSDRGLRTTAYPVSPVALAKKVAPLTAEIVESPASSLFHLGPTDAPQVVVAFNQPVVDPDPAATTWPWVSVQGATVTSVSAHTVPGDPANAYLFTLTPAGVDPITFAPVAGQSCASGGICTAAGAVLSAVPATAHTIAWVDTVAPALAATDAATVRGATLTLTFDEALASANTAASAFAVTGGTTRTISGVAVNGSTVQLTIDPPILYGEPGIEVGYTAPSREALADAAGNRVASFEDRAVSNETPATTLSTGVSLSLDTPSVSEGGSAKSVALTAMLNRSARPAATAVTVEVGAVTDTATEGTDYATVDDLTLTIPAYSTSGTARFTLTPMNDRIDELGESLTVTGSTAVAGLTVTPPGGLALDIEDNDAAPSLALSVSASTIDEDGGTAMVIVSTGSGSTYATDQTVRLAVAGTATENVDYTISGRTLTLPAGVGTGASMVTATVTGVDDNLDDDDEVIEITGSRNGVAFGSRQTIAIEDDDWPELTVTFRQADYRVAEGAHVDLPITLSAVPERQVTIPIEFEDLGGAEAIDYSVSPASLAFGANETDKTLRVSAANDSPVDLGESVALRFGTPLPDRVSEGGTAEATVAIRDTDFTFAPAFAAGSGTTESDTDTYAVSEASSALRLSLTLETPRGARVADVADPVVVTLATRENAGSREADEDYATQRRSGTFGDYGALDRDLSFAPGDFSDDSTCGCATAEKLVSVDLFNDRVYERTEVFGLKLSRKSRRLSVSSQDVTVKIDEDDAEPALTLDADPARIAEAGGVSTVTVSTGAGSTFPSAQTIRLELGGTATRDADYTIDATALTLPAGMGEDPSTVSTTVRALDDPFDDNAETVALSATRDGVEFASRAVAIADDDIGSTRADLAVHPAEVREDAGATTVRVTAALDGAAREEDTAVSVTVGSPGDSAVEGTDYATVPDLTLTIDAGETAAEATFRLAPTNNDAVEGAKTITVDGSVSGLAVRSADLTLNDDDVESTQVTLTLDPREVRESAGSRTVRVTGTLDGGARPTETVLTVTVGSGADSASEGTDYAEVPELELAIPANRTDGAVSFALRPMNDGTAEGTETISVRGDVAGLTVTPAELAIADDDTVSTRLDLSLNPSTVSEAAVPTEVVVTGSLDAGARATATVVTVTVGAAADAATEGSDYAHVSTLAITVPAHETTGRTTFTLSPDDDAIAEGAETISVTGRAGALTVEPATLTLSDNDTASRVVTLSVVPESVSEDTPEDVTVTASLNAGARADDTAVRLTVGAAGDTAVPGTDYERVSERTLTIAAGETSGTAVFRLEPLDNDSADGARTLSVTGSTTVAELRIEPATGARIALADDDSPAVLVVPDVLTVVEAGSDTYSVELQTRPTAQVTVTITGVSGDLSLDKTSLVFTGADWSDPRDVRVTAADDADSVRDPDVTLTHRASGAAEYEGLRAQLVVSIRENDPGLVFSESALRVPEGQTATYTVALATAPTDNVTVTITGVSGDLSLDRTRLDFTGGDWNIAQTVTVRAAEDDDTSTDPSVTLTHEASGGGYDGIVGSVRVSVTENDGGGTGGGSGGGGGANRPPVVEREIDDQALDVGEVLELDIRLNFYDRDQRALDYTVESADASVATVEVDRNGVLTIRGVSRGVTAITVTVADRRDERASDTFLVAVKGPALVALLPRASDPVREGFVRVINHDAEAGEVTIEAVDDTGMRRGPITLSVDAGAAAHFNSGDLEDGNADKGLPTGVGSGEGDWRLMLNSDLDFEALSYIRTYDGFLTSMHDTVPVRDGAYEVAIFNPGSNPNQVSGLRLVNAGSEDAEVTITGVDDAGASPGSTVVLTVPAGGSRTILAAELESGGEGVSGALGDGVGKWRLRVESEEPIIVMSLLSSPTGHLTNLSTAPDQGGM